MDSRRATGVVLLCQGWLTHGVTRSCSHLHAFLPQSVSSLDNLDPVLYSVVQIIHYFFPLLNPKGRGVGSGLGDQGLLIKRLGPYSAEAVSVPTSPFTQTHGPWMTGNPAPLGKHSWWGATGTKQFLGSPVFQVPHTLLCSDGVRIQNGKAPV